MHMLACMEMRQVETIFGTPKLCLDFEAKLLTHVGKQWVRVKM